MPTSQPATVWGYKRKGWPAIRISGRDRLDFLQRLSSQNFKSLPENNVVPGAFLHGNGGVIALFLALSAKDEVTLTCEPQSQPLLIRHLDKMHFGEKLEIQTELRDWVEIRGPQSRDFMKKEFGIDSDASSSWPRPLYPNGIWPAENWDGPGWLVPAAAAPSDLPLLNETEYYFNRALHLFPRDQVDIGENTIILESGLDDYIHRNKGCYPGQEVVERIFTYGNVAKKLVLLEGHAKELEKGNELFASEKKVGHVTSRHAGQGSSYFYVATVLRLQATLGNVFSLGAGQTPGLKVVKIAGSTEG